MMINKQSKRFFLFLTPFLLSTSIEAASYAELFKLSRFNGTKSVTSTIVITKSGTYDFKNVLHIWKGTNHPCTGDKENGPQILRIEADNVVVKNFSFIGDGKTHGSKGLGDPIHIATCGRGQGNLCTRKGPKNVVVDAVYGHACEDMITVGTPGAQNISIENSTLIANPSQSAWDKTVQINFGSNIQFYNNRFIGGNRCVRFKPQTNGRVERTKFEGCKDPVMLSSKDADISPMKNGPSWLDLNANSYDGKSPKCKETGSLPGSGRVTCR